MGLNFAPCILQNVYPLHKQKMAQKIPVREKTQGSNYVKTPGKHKEFVSPQSQIPLFKRYRILPYLLNFSKSVLFMKLLQIL